MQGWIYVLVALVVQKLDPVYPCLCLLLGSSYKCPEPPSCCESGYYALDECGCCMKCAKAELQTCGGASSISGRCGDGLQCLKTCLPCKTVGDSGKPCIFPFIYQNTTYDRCTSRDSDTGQPWCATAIDNEGYVIDYAWGDCDEGCPGTRVECDERYFSIEEGVCIDVSVPGAIPNWFGAPAVKLDPPTEVLFPAPVCKNKGKKRFYENTCRCDRGETAMDYDLLGNPRGNCTGLDLNTSDNLDEVWCFLENIRSPEEPRSGCYSDIQWSAKDGRFWSSLACIKDPDVEEGDLSTFSNLPPHRFDPPQVNSRPNPGPIRPPPTARPPPTTSTTTTTRTLTTSQVEEPRSLTDFRSKSQVGVYDDLYDEIFNYDDDRISGDLYEYSTYEDYLDEDDEPTPLTFTRAEEEEDYDDLLLSQGEVGTEVRSRLAVGSGTGPGSRIIELDDNSATVQRSRVRTTTISTDGFRTTTTAARTDNSFGARTRARDSSPRLLDAESYVFIPEEQSGNK